MAKDYLKDREGYVKNCLKIKTQNYQHVLKTGRITI